MPPSTRTLPWLAFLLAGSLAVGSSPPDEQPRTEKQKIEALIARVENLKDAQFVRNGKEYDGKTAARFLRSKWEANEDDVKTARDFVEKVASASSTSGKPYLIRFKDGKERKSGEYLHAELKQMEKAALEPGKVGRDRKPLSKPRPLR